MTLTEFIKHLQTLEPEYGDLKVVLTAPDNYWGSIDTELDASDIDIQTARPKGPRSGNEQCVVLG